jgi:membrane protein
VADIKSVSLAGFRRNPHIYGLFNNASSLGGQLAGLGGIVPAGGIDIIKDQITELTAESHKALGFASIVGLAISLWSANSGVTSLFDALNTIYHEREKRSFFRRTLISFGFTLGIIGFVTIALCAVVVVPIVLNFIGLGSVSKLMLSILRWPFMLIVTIIGLTFVYRYGPSRNPARLQWVSWGSAIAAVSWISVSLAFSYYVANFGSYNKTYGSLGAVVGFMTWIWISSITVLMGAELNAELEQQTQRDSTIGPEKPKGMRGAYKADVKPGDWPGLS